MGILVKDQTKRQLDGIRSAKAGAYLFVGPASVGKAEAARRLVDELCQEPSHAIIQEPNEKGSIGIGDVLEIERLLSLKLPESSATRLVVIEDADALTREAQNALLKTLEEPPAQTVIILTSAQRGKILPTILSRCIIIPFHRLTRGEIADFLNKEHQTDSEAATQAAGLSRGAVGVATRLASDKDYHKHLSTHRKLARELISSDLYAKLLIASDITSSKDLDPVLVAEQAAELVREQLSQGPHDRHGLRQLKALERFLVRSGSNVNMKLLLDQLAIGLDHA